MLAGCSPFHVAANIASIAAAALDEADEGLLKDVAFYALDSRQESILWDVKPAFVVVYDPDVTFVRQLEVWHDCAALPWTKPIGRVHVRQAGTKGCLPQCFWRLGES